MYIHVHVNIYTQVHNKKEHIQIHTNTNIQLHIDQRKCVVIKYAQRAENVVFLGEEL